MSRLEDSDIPNAENAYEQVKDEVIKYKRISFSLRYSIKKGVI